MTPIVSSCFAKLKHYPISMTIIAIVTYLSFFKPPTTDLGKIPNFDKIVHFSMYFGMSLVLWFEFLRSHRNDKVPMHHVWAYALVFPIMFSGCVELLQEYCTTYRGGDWRDFAANSLGALIASLISYFIVAPKVLKKSKNL